MGLEFNATLFAQVIDLLILILFFAGIVILIAKVRSSKKSVSDKIESMENELKEIRVMLEERKR